MTMNKFVGLGAVFIFLGLGLAPLRAADPAPGQDYALLIGVSQYGDPQIRPRPHAEDDVRALYDLLADKAYVGVKPENMRLLLGHPDTKRKSETATHENILKALHWLADKPGRSDHVYFAFVGEGGPLSASGGLLGYFALDTTIKNRAKNAVAAAEICQELDKLKSEHFCAFIDVNFRGYKEGPEKIGEPMLERSAYREFRGADRNDDRPAAPGRVLFLATNGMHPMVDTDDHGLFTKVVLDGLKGAADTEGYGADGVVTVDELVEYVEKTMPEMLRKYGKTDAEKRLHSHVLVSRSSHFVLSKNPAVREKVVERLKKLEELLKTKKITEAQAAEGRKLLERMPKLKAYQELRRSYEKLAQGQEDPGKFVQHRDEILSGLKIQSSAARAYATKVIQSTQIIRDNYVKEIHQGDLVAWAIRGLYRQIEEKLPADVRERLDKVRDMSEQELTNLLTQVREQLGQREDLENHRDIDISLQRMLAHLDPYTTYIDPDMLSRFEQDTSGKFKGIGIKIHENQSRGGLEVATPLIGSPAYRAGLKAGDLIISITREVDSEGNPLAEPEVISTKGLSTNEAVKKIQGKPGTKIKLTVERKGVKGPLEFEVSRDVIEVETVLGSNRKDDDHWNFLIDPSNRICYVRLTSFARNTYRDLRRALTDLHRNGGINGLILDLRFNPGGLLTSAVEISDLFLEDGLIVTVRPRAGRSTAYPAEPKEDRRFLNFPMVVLVNGLSASGSEIVSACLQDHERAIVMGERSYGKGSVQNIQPFEGGELKMTTASFWRPSGKNLNKSSTTGKDKDEWGVTPNKGYLLKLTEKEREQLFEQQQESESIPRRDLPADPDKKQDLKDRQLEIALQYLRNQIQTAAKLSKKAG
jgi:carboxyl-terminal processing protease